MMRAILGRVGALAWAIGFLMVMVGGLIRGPALGIGATIEHPRWQDGTLEYEFDGTTHRLAMPTSPMTPPTLDVTPHYTTPLADWDSILLLRQDLEVRSATGQVMYHTDTTRLRLGQTALLGCTVGQVADGFVCMGTAGCLIGPLLVMRRHGWLSALWVAVVVGYLVN